MTKKIEKKSCLLVDDSDDALSILTKTLEPYFEITKADNGLVAWDIFLEEEFDVVICDFVMPVMNGVELASRIRAKGSDVPIYLITGFDVVDMEDFNREIQKLKISSLLIKPLSKDALSKIIDLTG